MKWSLPPCLCAQHGAHTGRCTRAGTHVCDVPHSRPTACPPPSGCCPQSKLASLAAEAQSAQAGSGSCSFAWRSVRTVVAQERLRGPLHAAAELVGALQAITAAGVLYVWLCVRCVPAAACAACSVQWRVVNCCAVVASPSNRLLVDHSLPRRADPPPAQDALLCAHDRLVNAYQDARAAARSALKAAQAGVRGADAGVGGTTADSGSDVDSLAALDTALGGAILEASLARGEAALAAAAARHDAALTRAAAGKPARGAGSGGPAASKERCVPALQPN